jgi:hypothetical protein
MMRRLVLAFAAVALNAPAWADGPPCESKVAQACYTTRGALFVANGTPSFRIAVADSTRVLGIIGGETPPLPDAVRKALGVDVFSNRAWGDYTVCPQTPPQLNEMQMVCVQSAANLRPEAR